MTTMTTSKTMKTKDPIDAVILWVDGEDPEWKAKCEVVRGGNPMTQRNDIGGELRYRQMREIDWCVASINRFASFVRKIFIVTDHQDPHLERTVGKWFPDPIPVEIVDHTDIFKGFEKYLPVFNSRALESMLHRIPNLSERYLYLNDDMFFMSESKAEDWFRQDGKVTAYGKWWPTWSLELLHSIKPKKHGLKNVGFKDSMMNAAKVLGSRKTLVHGHNPRAFLKSISKKFFESYPEAVITNISSKFRSPDQYNTTEAEYLLMDREGLLHVESTKGNIMFLKPFASRPTYLRDHLKRIRHQKFGCINSIPMADRQDANAFVRWIDELLNIKSIQTSDDLDSQEG